MSRKYKLVRSTVKIRTFKLQLQGTVKFRWTKFHISERVKCRSLEVANHCSSQITRALFNHSEYPFQIRLFYRTNHMFSFINTLTFATNHLSYMSWAPEISSMNKGWLVTIVCCRGANLTDDRIISVCQLQIRFRVSKLVTLPAWLCHLVNHM